MASNPYLKALERYKQKTGQRSQKELSIMNVMEEKLHHKKFLEDQPEDADENELAELVNEIDSDSLRVQQEATKRQMGAGKALGGSILTQSRFKETSSRIGRLSKSYDVQLGAYSAIGTSSSKLSKRLGGYNQGLENLSSRMRGMIDPETGVINDESKFRKYAGASGHLERKIAESQLTMKYQRDRGLDPIGIVTGAQTTADRADSVLRKDKVIDQAKSGAFGSIGQESEKLTAKLAILTQAIGELNTATDSERDSKEEAVKNAEEEVRTQNEILTTTKQYGGSAVDQLGGARGIANSIGDALKQIGSAYSTTQIVQPLQIMNNQRRFMEMQNERYGTMRSMSGGDQMALMKTMGMYGAQSKFTSDFLAKGQWAKGVDLGADAIGGITDVATQALAVKSGNIAAVGGALKSAVGVGSGLYTGGMDFERNVSAGSVAASAGEQYRAFFESINQIPAAQMQAHENQYRASYRTGTGFGTNSTIMGKLNDYSSGSMMDQLSQLSISPERASALSELGGRMVGGRDFDIASLKSAGTAEKAGITSAEQYTQMLGAMTDVGGNNQDLYNVMKSAVTIGMDDSKSINRMVSATISLSDKSASRGMMATSGVNEALMRGAGSLSDSLMTTSQKAIVTQSQTANLSNLLSEGGTDIYSLQEFSKISKILGKDVGYESAISLEKAGLAETEMFRTLATSDEGSKEYNKAAESIIRAGYAGGRGSTFSKDAWVRDPQKLKQFLATKQAVALERVVGMTDVSAESRSTLSDYVSGNLSDEEFYDKMPSKDLTTFRTMASRRGLGDEGFFRDVFSGKNIDKDPITASVSREIAQQKMSVEAGQKYLESKEGQNKILKTMKFDEWNKAETARAANTLANAETGTSTQKEIDQARTFLDSSVEERKSERVKHYQKSITGYMTEAVKSGTTQDQGEREQEAGNLKGPSGLVDASKAFKSGVDAFGKVIQEDFTKAIAKFDEAVSSMKDRSSRDDMPATIGSEKNNKALEGGVTRGGRTGRSY